MWHLIAHWLGLDNASGRAYLGWSGFGSDIGEISIVGALIALVRHKNCEVHGCWRLGRHATAAGHSVCRRHHPDGHLTADTVMSAHKAAAARPDLRAALAAHCADIKEHVSAVAADRPARGGAGRNPAKSESLPADGPVGSPPAAKKGGRL